MNKLLQKQIGDHLNPADLDDNTQNLLNVISGSYDLFERDIILLTRSNEELQNTNTKLDRFAYTVSHDLRAPMASILGLIEYSETEISPAEMLDNINLIKRSIKRMDGYVADIIEYSRNAKTELNNDNIDFKAIIDEVIENLKFISKGEVEIRTNIQNGMSFYSDKVRIGIIFSNLISNALQYYNPSLTNPYIDINISLTELQANITIKDNGIGIDKAHQGKIFEMFYRVSKKPAGSGLGLFIVREAVEKIKGTISLNSTPGTGSEFNVVLPNLITLF